MAICILCDKLTNRSHTTKPHGFLRPVEEKRIFGTAKKTGFAEQDYQCLQCGAKFTHSTDKNDFGWTLWQG